MSRYISPPTLSLTQQGICQKMRQPTCVSEPPNPKNSVTRPWLHYFPGPPPSSSSPSRPTPTPQTPLPLFRASSSNCSEELGRARKSSEELGRARKSSEELGRARTAPRKHSQALAAGRGSPIGQGLQIPLRGPVRALPSSSELFRALPSSSKLFQALPSSSELFRIVRKSSEAEELGRARTAPRIPRP